MAEKEVVERLQDKELLAAEATFVCINSLILVADCPGVLGGIAGGLVTGLANRRCWGRRLCPTRLLHAEPSRVWRGAHFFMCIRGHMSEEVCWRG